MSVLPRDSIFEDSIDPIESGDDRAQDAIFAAHAVSLQAVPLPTSLRDRLVRDGQRALGASAVSDASAVQPPVTVAPQRKPAASETAPIPFPQPSASRQAPTRSPLAIVGYLGWAVAAALALVAIPGLLNRGASPGSSSSGSTGPITVATPPTIDQIAGLSDTVRATFKPDPSLTDLAGSSGEVIWNDRLQTGFMRLTSLPVNDPNQMQYQLWIVDPARDKNPVDGGVFNIASTTGEVIVPIDAKLAVNDPKVFAITRERPGGVVVSAGPLALVASR
jgi:hypothetical protein